MDPKYVTQLASRIEASHPPEYRPIKFVKSMKHQVY